MSRETIAGNNRKDLATRSSIQETRLLNMDLVFYQVKSEQSDVDSKKEIKRGGKQSAFYNVIYYVSLLSFHTFNLIAFVTFIFNSICRVDFLGPAFYLIVSF